MGARLPLCIVGAVLMLVSLFLPTLFRPWVIGEYFGEEIDGAFYYWIYGFFYTWITEEGTYYTEYSPYSAYVFDMLGIICVIIIIIGAILAIVLGAATEHKAAFIGGLLGILGMIIFLVGVNTGLPLTPLAELTNDGYYFIPFIGFFVCITGGILALVGGTLEKY